MANNISYSEMDTTAIELLPATVQPSFKYIFLIKQQDKSVSTEHTVTSERNYLLHKQIEYLLYIGNGSTDDAYSPYLKQQTPIEVNVIMGIMAIQSEYFLNGNIRSLKVMRLKDVADLTGLHLSTVAKVIRNKSLETPFATISIKELFSEGICNVNGELVSNKVIQNEIAELIETEGKHHPISDRKISELLQRRGYSVARRTVSKYRDILQIPVSYARHI